MVLISFTFLISSVICFLVATYYITRLSQLVPSEDGQSFEAWLVLSFLFGSILFSFFVDTLDGIVSSNKLFQRTLETAINFKLLQVGIINRLADGYYRKRKWSLIVYRFLQPAFDVIVFTLLCVPILIIAGESQQPAYNNIQGIIHTGYYNLNFWFQSSMILVAVALGFVIPNHRPQAWFKVGCFVWALGPIFSLIADLTLTHPEWMYIADWVFIGLAIALTGVGILRSYMINHFIKTLSKGKHQ